VFVQEPKFESGGKYAFSVDQFLRCLLCHAGSFFPLVFTRIVLGVVIAQVTLVGMLVIRKVPVRFGYITDTWS
jgi:hypothetical protein